jgi:hypothetical protein
MNLDNVTLSKEVLIKFIQKKFYRKYIYKLEYQVPRAYAPVLNSFYKRSQLTSRKNSMMLSNTIQRIVTDQDYRFRIEQNTLSFFTNSEKDVITLISDKSIEKLICINRPINSLHVDTIEINKRIRVRNNLFQDKFKYKVYFKNIYKLKDSGFADIRNWTEITENIDDNRWGLNNNLKQFLSLKPGESDRNIGWTIAVFLNDPEDLMMFQLKFHDSIDFIEEAVLLSDLYDSNK